MASTTAPRLQAPSDPPPSVSQAVGRSAFAASGLWAPGIMVMRRLRFTAKMGLLMAFMIAALAAVAFAYYSTMLGNIAFSAKERDGVRYVRAVYPALVASLDARRDATARAAGNANAPLETSNRALQTALQALDKEDAVLGADLGSASAIEAVRQAAREASAGSNDAQAVFQRYTRTARALVDLAAHVCDTSNLTLDPEVHTYYIMDAVCFRLPDVMERTGALRGAGNAALQQKTLEPLVATQMAKQDAVIEFHLHATAQGLAKTQAVRPETTGLIRLTDAQQATERFLQRLEDTILTADILDPAHAADYVAAGNAALHAQRELADRLLPLLDELLAERVAAMQTEMIIRSIVIAVLVLTATYFAYGFFLVNRGGTRLIQRHLGLIAEGDLRDPPPQPWGTDEAAQIIGDMRVAYDSLHALIRKVRHAARDLASASEEIAHASRDLGTRTEAAAANLEEQASAMEQIGSQVGSTAQRAQEAADFSRRNAEMAASSRQVVDSVIGTMRDIQGSSQKIADIIGVIDGIAFQTNILALNAAVEAARAGEAGRGFAVVASEVRALAQRSAEAARQIKALIEESVNKVQTGVTVVEQAGTTMGKLVHNAATINEFMAQISTAAREQSAGVEQSVQAIQQLDASTQQNAALVEQTSAAAAALEQQAQRLMDEIARFRL